MATKEQESKALEQIKKIVEDLGEGSYLAAAFEGCFDVAEENIRCDFGCSMKQRAESAEKAAEDLRKELSIMKARAEALEILKKESDERNAEKITARDARIRTLTHQSLSSDTRLKIVEHLSEDVKMDLAWLKEDADTMVHFSDCPKDIGFTEAVKHYKKTDRHKTECEKLISEITKTFYRN